MSGATRAKWRKAAALYAAVIVAMLCMSSVNQARERGQLKVRKSKLDRVLRKAQDIGDRSAKRVIVRTKSLPSLPAGVITNDFVVCGPGERAVGGGASFSSFSGKEQLSQSYPVSATGAPSTSGQTPVGWRSHVYNETAFPVTPVLYVVCAAP